MKIIIKLFSLLIVLSFVSTVQATTIIEALVTRNQNGSGTTFISSGFPLPPGLVTENIITDKKIKVIVEGNEVAANVSALRGRHNDGTVRSAFIQFTVASMAEDDTLTASVQIDNGVRTKNDPAYVRPTQNIVLNNNVLLPIDPNYLVSTQITFQNLLPIGEGTPEEEKQYTTLANDRFDFLVANPNEGAARYEKGRAMLTLWARTGNIKYFNEAVTGTFNWLAYNTFPVGQNCTAQPATNPDGRTSQFPTQCPNPAEHMGPVTFSYASMYLLTGYRDYWSIVSYLAQYNRRNITSAATSDQYTIAVSPYDAPRYNYTHRYGALLAAYMIDATMPISGNNFSAKQMDLTDQMGWTVDSIIDSGWDLKWIPFDSGAGTVPALGATITQGAVSATFHGVYTRGMYEPPTTVGNAMPTTGYIQVNNITGGSFTTGALTGISASATGAEESDQRQGYVGTVSYSPRVVATKYLPVFQSIFPLNFLIDYYLNVDADSRIPAIIKTNIDIILTQMSLLVDGDWAYNNDGGIWGDTTYGNPYELRNPVSTEKKSPWELPEYARMIAFVLKTLGDDTVKGASYTTWYSRCIDTANNSPLQNLTWEWKLFGQFYGFGADTPWIMAQQTLPTSLNRREPKFYQDIPSDIPELHNFANETPIPQIKTIDKNN